MWLEGRFNFTAKPANYRLKLTSRRMVARRPSRLAQRVRTASRRLQCHSTFRSNRRAALPFAVKSRLAA